MKVLDYNGFIIRHNGRLVEIYDKTNGKFLWVSRDILQTALDFSVDIEE